MQAGIDSGAEGKRNDEVEEKKKTRNKNATDTLTNTQTTAGTAGTSGSGTDSGLPGDNDFREWLKSEYVIVGRIGKGAFSRVYEIEDANGKKYALKVYFVYVCVCVFRLVPSLSPFESSVFLPSFPLSRS